MQDIPLPKTIIFEKRKDNTEKVIIEPCFPGYGTTLGNSLRRVLLSSLPGAAVTSVKIDEVSHEFSTIKNVKEDVMDILLNLKLLRLKLFSDNPIKLTLKAKAEKEVTAKDITPNSNVEIANPDLHIASLTSKDAKLSMELTVEKGQGYVTVEEREREKVEIGTILIDALFSPIQNVRFDIENVRVGEKTNYDKLTLEIKTDGTITAKDAFRKAAQILVNHFQYMSQDKKEVKSKEKIEKGVKQKKTKSKKEAPQKVEELGFSTRTLNALRKASIKNIFSLTSKTEEQLLALDGLGEKAAKEIKRKLKKLGLALKE
ncbi:DNA-directed RNA polymerase subunit alpha [bacterium (Candidatus Torokbacteria) CG_4_10_14_0_2_um_filter_35_8]|nr:MAG: DNA-directed RNA polymerase subunit alpha [bacterium (Candidatus Torokbacteria) CG_4_10_14_0_2_um_filter_35_8]